MELSRARGIPVAINKIFQAQQQKRFFFIHLKKQDFIHEELAFKKTEYLKGSWPLLCHHHPPFTFRLCSQAMETLPSRC